MPFPPIDETSYSLTLAPYSFLWLELQPAAEVTEILPEPRIELAEPIVREEAEAFDLFANGWSGWLTRLGIRLLETTLPAWLPRQRWFGAKTRTIHSVNLLDWVELPSPLPVQPVIPSLKRRLRTTSRLPCSFLRFSTAAVGAISISFPWHAAGARREKRLRPAVLKA